MTSIIGHLHPLLVHLPIGFLLLGVIFWGMQRGKVASFTDEVYQWILLLSGLVGSVTVLSGFVQASEEGFSSSSVLNHKVAGVLLTVFCFVAYFLWSRMRSIYQKDGLWLFLLVLVTITGHWGGLLTHGENYFSSSSTQYTKPSIDDLPDAEIYDQIIEPIFAQKCWSCHSEKKSKGDFRMDSPDLLLNGGEHGLVLDKSHPDKSDLWMRVSSPVDDDNHMPPTGKEQLSDEEITLVSWWIDQGFPFVGKIEDYSRSPEVDMALSSLQGDAETPVSLPEDDPGPANEAEMAKARAAGFVINQIGTESNFLSVSAFIDDIKPEAWSELLPLVDRVVWMKVVHQKVDDDVVAIISDCTHLRILSLNDCAVSATSLKTFSKLSDLEELSIIDTKLPEEATDVLTRLSNLKSLHLYQTNIATAEIVKKLPHTTIDTGGYIVRTLASDTTVFTKEERKLLDQSKD